MAMVAPYNLRRWQVIIWLILMTWRRLLPAWWMENVYSMPMVLLAGHPIPPLLALAIHILTMAIISWQKVKRMWSQQIVQPSSTLIILPPAIITTCMRLMTMLGTIVVVIFIQVKNSRWVPIAPLLYQAFIPLRHSSMSIYPTILSSRQRCWWMAPQ